MTCTTQRAWINKPIIRSVTATDTGVSLSWPVVPLITPLAAKNVSLVQQKLAVHQYFARSFMKWSVRKQLLRGGILSYLNDTVIVPPTDYYDYLQGKVFFMQLKMPLAICLLLTLFTMSLRFATFFLFPCGIS